MNRAEQLVPSESGTLNPSDILKIIVFGVLMFGHAIGSSAEEEAIPYSQAKHTQDPYLCTYQYPSFFGDDSYFEAKIQGDDFIAVNVSKRIDLNESLIQHYARKNNIGYCWNQSHHSNPFKYNLTIINKYLATIPDASTEFGNALLFAPPTPEAQCKRTSHIDITIPEIPFQDQTQLILDVLKDRGNRGHMTEFD